MSRYISSAQELYQALRTVIPNLPAEHVLEVTVKCGPMDSLPTCTVVQCCLNANGEPYVDRDGADASVATETKRFVLVPEERYAEYAPLSDGVMRRVEEG